MLLSTEAKYVAETHAAKEGIWLKPSLRKLLEKGMSHSQLWQTTKVQ